MEENGPLVFTLEPAMKLTEQGWLWLALTSIPEDFAQSKNIFSLGQKELQPSMEVNLSRGCDGCALTVEPDLNPTGSLGSRKNGPKEPIKKKKGWDIKGNSHLIYKCPISIEKSSNYTKEILLLNIIK